MSLRGPRRKPPPVEHCSASRADGDWKRRKSELGGRRVESIESPSTKEPKKDRVRARRDNFERNAKDRRGYARPRTAP